MRYGICTGIDNIDLVQALGFDYLEPSVTSIAGMTQAHFDAACARVRAAGIRCECFNVLFPGDMALLSDTTREDALRAYLEPALARVRALGGEVVVFGSGRCRMRSEGMPYDQAFRRLVEVYRLVGQVASAHGLTIAAEPLNRSETNMLCSMAETAALCAAVNLPNVRLLSDYYHVMTDGEPLGDVARIGGLAHVHVATKAGRRYPLADGPGEALDAFFAALLTSGYDGRMSIEGGTDDMQKDGAASLAFLKELEHAARLAR